MDSDTYNDIAYSHHVFCSPVHGEQINELMTLLDMHPGDPVLDMGCGKAELLIRLAEYCQVKAIGVDPSERLIQDAYEAFHTRAPGIDITLHQMPLTDYSPEPESAQIVLCVNASQMYGGYDKALVALHELVKPGGMLLMGQFYWTSPPSAAQTDAVETVYYDYANTIQRGIEQGLMPTYAISSPQHTIDRYHWLKTYAIEKYTVDNPDSSDRAAILKRARNQRDRYVTLLRDTLGFGLFLFRKPAED
jgi:cyclopropane fatty-acyl-phospholipid synthase-like methyltransferase